jgi:hypothetical protein
MKKILFLLFFVFTSSCADVDTYHGDNGVQKSLIGSECSQGCIWSTWAVSSGVQKLTHYCDGEGCHCVEVGNIYNSCSIVDNNTGENNEEQLTTESIDHSSIYYNSLKGDMIADEAYWEASRRGTVGWCYNAVADAVERVTGRFLWGEHAYQAADQFALSPHFFEVWNRDLKSLPAGAVVVWGKGTSRSGHISVALGNGQEASDHIASQMTYHYGGAPARIFLPK